MLPANSVTKTCHLNFLVIYERYSAEFQSFKYTFLASDPSDLVVDLAPGKRNYIQPGIDLLWKTALIKALRLVSDSVRSPRPFG